MSGKQRHIRKRRALDEQEELPDGPEGGEEEAPRLTAEDIRLMQKQRQRRTGVEASTLGMAHLRADKKAAAAAGEERDAGGGGGLQAAFKRERRLFSEEDDPHMKEYVEEQLAKRMGRETDADVAARAAEEERKRRQADPFLAALPEGLQKRQQDTELGNSWVAGMAEIPLTLEQKLANIEATEAAKKQMLSIVPGEDDDLGGGGGPAARRGAFPVAFGRQNPKHQQVIAETQARKAQMRERQEEKKRKKKEEFKGW